MPQSITQLTQDWKFPLQPSKFTGYIPDPGDRDPAGTILRCMTLTKIPCSQDIAIEKSITRVHFAVIRVVKRGWVNAPYKKPKAAKTGTNAKKTEADKDIVSKPLFEDIMYMNRESVRVYNFSKANSPSDKGPRVDDCYSIICPGQTLTFSTISEYFFKEYTFPNDMEIIEPYTMVDLVVIPSTVEQARNGDKGGYGIKLNKVRVHDSSIYSYLKDLPKAFEPSPVHASAFVQGWFQVPTEDGTIPMEAIRNCLDSKAPLYFVTSEFLPTNAFVTNIRPDLDFFRIQTADSSPLFYGVSKVDLHIPTVLKLLNTEDQLYAKTLLDFAIAAKAVSFFGNTDDWYNKVDSALSTTRGLPIIDASKLLADVTVSNFDINKPYVDFPVSFTPPATIKTLAISVPMVSKPFLDANIDQVPTSDFILVGPGVKLERAYEVTFVEEDDILLTTYLNAQAGSSVAGYDAGVPTVYQRVSRKRSGEKLDAY